MSDTKHFFCLWGIILVLFSYSFIHPQDFFYSRYDQILKEYVDSNGLVDYKGLQKHPDNLMSFLNSLKHLDPDVYQKWDLETKIAFWINTYNACTLQVIIDHYPIKSSFFRSLTYPKNSIRQISGVWDKITFPIMGNELTLEHMEHHILRKEFNEARIHMALVCAAQSCPPLRQEAYTGERLYEQLDDQARIFLSRSQNFRIDTDKKIIYLSSIFKWFKKDFGPEENAILQFISQYVDQKTADLLGESDFRKSHIKYNWSLNERLIP